MKQINSWKTFLPLAFCVLLFAIYFLLVRNNISLSIASNVEIGLLVGLILASLVGVAGILISLIGIMVSKNRSSVISKIGGRMVFLISVIALLFLFVGASQWTAHTPSIMGEDGKPLPNSIASMEKVRLGGTDQWLIIRGEDVNKPVLLFLSGGPGASEAARVIRFNQELEKDFVVVIWEQRGCGKSYPARTNLTVEQYASDVIELTEMLKERFDEKKIYLMGHSWGSIIGVRAAQIKPYLYHAFIGSAQMVDVLETDLMIYQMIMEHSRNTGDNAFVQTLEKQGPPPYLGKSPIQPYSTLFGREYTLFEYPNIQSEEYRKDGDILFLMLKQPEYGWLDRVYYALGLMNTFNAVYPQLQEMDFRLDATKLDLPFYMILGRHDMNNPYEIPEEYFQMLDTPKKQLFFFEKSGHGMIWEEADLFHEIMVNTILPETYQP